MTYLPKLPIKVSTDNSSSTPLAANATFTGTGEDILNYKQQHISLYFRPNIEIDSDASTAKGSLFFEYSDDNSNWDISVPHFIQSGIVIPITPITIKRYFRVRYVNDGGVAAIAALGSGTAGTATAQNTIRLTTILVPDATKELARTMEQTINRSDGATVVRAVLMGEKLSSINEFTNVNVNDTGQLATADF